MSSKLAHIVSVMVEMFCLEMPHFSDRAFLVIPHSASIVLIFLPLISTDFTSNPVPKSFHISNNSTNFVLCQEFSKILFHFRSACDILLWVMAMIDMKKLGENIRQMRKMKGLTQEELAEKSNLSTMSIRRYESGKRIITEIVLGRIANALDVGIYEFFPVGEEIDIAGFPRQVLHPPTIISNDGERSSVEIVADIIKRAGITVKDSDGNVIIQGDGVTWHKLSEAEMYRAGFLKFNSEEDRIAFFYSRLNEDGKLAASGCFYRHLDKESLKEVADFILNLSENPLYQRHAPVDALQSPQATDTTEAEKPPTDAQVPADATQEGEE